MLRLSLLLLLSLFGLVQGRVVVGTSSANEIDAPDSSPEDYTMQMTERFKARLLDKLKLSSPPKVTNRVPEKLRAQMAALVRQGNDKSVDEEYYAQTEKILSFAKSVLPCGQSNKQVCFHVGISEDLGLDEVRSARLMLQKPESGQVYRVYDMTERSKPVLLKVDTNSAPEGLAAVDIMALLQQSEGLTLNSPLMFALYCDGCTDLMTSVQAEPPYLELNVHSWKHQRSRRSINHCPDNNTTQCCMDRILVNFKQMAFGSIIAPEEIFLNFCYGKCESDELCCVPGDTSPLKVLLQYENGEVELKQIPDMMVNSCVCRSIERSN